MMRYTEQRAASGEILRLVIQEMARHPAAFTPLAYAVWYEHIAGVNSRLSDEIRKLQSADTKLDDGLIEKLYDEHVSECSGAASRLLREDLRKLLAKVAGVTAETDRQAHQFGGNLQSYGDKLKESLDPSTLTVLISEMTQDTKQMRGSVQQLQSQLEQSRREVEKLNQELENARGEAAVDPLTGILNRRGFEASTQEIVDAPASADKEFCLLMVDIDHFKKINDNYGHLVGDKVIRAVAEVLKSKVKGQDVVARWGGEEFAVLLPETGLKGALTVAEQIRQGIERGKIRRVDSQEPIGGVTVSIGVARHVASDSLSQLVDQADQALYISKQQGRNRTTVYTTAARQ